VKELMASNRQLAAVGNNLNQLTRYLNGDGMLPALADARRLLARIEAAIDTVDDAVDLVIRR
jgi:hypothetical protein